MEYLIKCNLNLLTFYIVYLIVFRNSTYFVHNRIYLLAAPLISFILPALNFPLPSAGYSSMLPDAFIMKSQRVLSVPLINQITGFQILAGLYIFITAFRLCVFFISIRKILNMRSFSEKAGSFYIIDRSYKIVAFSFFRHIFISENMNKDDQQIILQHESAHAKQWHSVDIIFYELLSTFFWFNPITFLLFKELKNVHEYLADKESVKDIPDKTIYCELLLTKAAASHSLQFTHSFIYINTLKNRIMMLTKNTRISLWRYTLIIPLLGALTYFSSCSKTTPTEQQQHGTSTIQNDSAPPEKMPEFKGGEEAMYKFLSANINYPPEAKNTKTEGRVVIKFMVDEKGEVSSIEIAKSAGKLLDEEALRVISSMPSWIPAQDQGKPIACKMFLPISFKLD